ncbi:MAG: hypothetical protein IEMM0007_0822 [bacterium]|nr:MAG: hypothetical protein IEMM0007_0822 [bacterium]
MKGGLPHSFEELQKERPLEARLALTSLLPLLRDNNPAVRGDAAYLIATVGGREGLGFRYYSSRNPW